jgi:branched-chain amino acid transport system ATP-binding protein
MSAPLLRVDGLVSSYGKLEVLKGVSLSVLERSVTCLLGPNGAGKTTLMLTLAGLLRPRRGSIRLAGREIAGAPPHDIVARGIALVPEKRQLFQRMSVRDNMLAGAYTRRDNREIEADIARMYARFPRLEERRDQDAGTLSGGEQQMLAVARALMSRPKLLLMDEPSHGLAPLAVEQVFGMIREINAQGTSVFLVDQNVHMALEAAHHFYLMDQGRVTFGGHPGQLAEDEVVHRACLGPMKTAAARAAAEAA